jgi:hypothetical protein
MRLKGQLPQQPLLRHYDYHNEHYDDSNYHDLDEHDLDLDEHNLDDAAAGAGLHPGYHLCGWPRVLLCQRQRCGDDLCMHSRGRLYNELRFLC